MTNEGEEDCVELLEKIKQQSGLRGSQTAFIGEGESLTYRQIEEYSGRLGGWLLDSFPEEKGPVVVYGHKNPYMLVCFWPV